MAMEKKGMSNVRICVRGIRELDFVSDGSAVKGTQLFFSYPREGVVGEITDKLFIRKELPLPPELVPGKYVDIFCDTKGRVEHIQLVAPASK